MNNDLVLITKEGCAYCLKAKTALKDRNISYTEKQIGKEISREAFIEKYPNQKTIPVALLNNGKLIGGYPEIIDYIVNIMEKKLNEEVRSIKAPQEGSSLSNI